MNRVFGLLNRGDEFAGEFILTIVVHRLVDGSVLGWCE